MSRAVSQYSLGKIIKKQENKHIAIHIPTVPFSICRVQSDPIIPGITQA